MSRIPRQAKRDSNAIFDSHVRVVDGEGCWEWTGGKVYGYGKWSDAHGVTWRAHRFSWERANGSPVPCGLVVMHKCDNRACVRPSHLEVGTQLENRQDAVRKGRTARGETSSSSWLTVDDIRAIRANHRRGRKSGDWTTAWVCQRYGLEKSAVRKIVAGTNWKYVA